MTSTTTLSVICRAVSPAMDGQNCELTCIARDPLSYARVHEQHQAYVAVFRAMAAEGYAIKLTELPALDTLPDSMFVEDVAMMYPTCAVLTRPGAASRQPEVDPIVAAVSAVRPDTYRIVDPGTVDGGDVLFVGKNTKYVFVGRSTRSNDAAYEQMRAYLGERGLECVQCTVRGCLHLKSAVSFLAEDTVILNPAWIESDIFTSRGFRVVEIDPAEQDSANVLSFVAAKTNKDDGSVEEVRTVLSPAAFPGTAARVAAFCAAETAGGRPTRQIVLEVDEIAKAEGALTCCSLLSYSN